MPQEITKKSILFPNNQEAIAVFPPATAKVEEIVAALEIKPHKAVILIIGGADAVDEKLKPRLIQLFGRGIARAAADANAVIIDGGTEAGVMAMMGQGVADRGNKTPLIGVAPLGKVIYPGSTGAGATKLDSNHSHFVLVEGSDWGGELSTIDKLAEAFTKKSPGVVILASGGPNSKNEALYAVRQKLPLIVVEGSGGVADEIAVAWKARPTLPEDPIMAEIIADGSIELHVLTNSVKGAERLIIRELGGDQVLLQAWEHFADYDLNAILQQQRFERIQRSILAIGILATALALIKQVRNPTGVFQRGDIWWFSYYILLLIPIILTILITAANRFKQGNKWLLLRAGAESIKREIYRYRARAGDYKEVSDTSPSSPPSTTSSPPPPPPTPEQVLSQRVEDITRRIMRTEVNTSALKPYNKDEGFPPYMYAAEGGDDGFSLLSPERYVDLRLGDQLGYFKKTARKLEGQLKLFQYTIFIVGGLGTFLAAINQQVWIALTTAVASALTTYLGYRQTENTLTKYNQAATDLANVKAWWTALPADDQAKQENVDTLVTHTEQVLESELDGWVQQMQNALAELRKGQEKAPEKEEPKGGKQADSPPPTEADKAATAKTAGENAAKNAGGEDAGASVGGDDAGASAGGEETGAGAGSDDTGANASGDDAGSNAVENAKGNSKPPGDKPVG